MSTPLEEHALPLAGGEIVENLLIVYAGILCINLIISAGLWFLSKAPLYRSVFLLWLAGILSFLMTGFFTQNDLAIALGFSATFLVNIVLSYLLSEVTLTKLPWRLFVFFLLLSYPLAIAGHLLQLSFVWIALPVTIAVGFPGLFASGKIIYTKWNELTATGKTFSIVAGLYSLHMVDFAFLRLDETFSTIGFSIGLLFGYCFSILVPAAVLEILTEKAERRIREEETQRRLLERELQTAHDLQMSLMPREFPQVLGFDVAGRCIPANHVGGDFFQYYQQDGKLAVCMADVTGHAMEAAVPVLMFSGILETEMRLDNPIHELFGHLNRTLYIKLDPRTFVCFAMGEIDFATCILRLSNSGCPYPYHFKASTGEVEELQMDAYPLGILPESDYTVRDIQLEREDYILFCSDGIIEAENGAGELFGFERTGDAIHGGCADGLPAEALIDRLIGKVREFVDDAPQGDDMTCIVIQVKKLSIDAGKPLARCL